jgi:hypothetical protein
MALTSSGQIKVSDIYKNRNDTASEPGADENISIKTVSDDYSANAATAGVSRANLGAEPYAMSEFYNAHYTQNYFDTVQWRNTSGAALSDAVDSESGRVYWDVNTDQELTGSHTGYLVTLNLVSDNSILASAYKTYDGESITIYQAITAPSTGQLVDKWYAKVSSGTYRNSVGAYIDHWNKVGAIAIDTESTSSVANASATADKAHGYAHTATYGAVSPITSSWAFAKVSGDGGNPSPTTSTSASPTIRYTGPGIYKADVTVSGQPTTARNSTAASSMYHAVEYDDVFTVSSPTSLNARSSTISVSGNQQGINGTVTWGLVTSGANTYYISSSTATKDSRHVAGTYGATAFITPEPGTYQARASGGTASANSSTFSVYTLLTDEFAAGDITTSAATLYASDETDPDNEADAGKKMTFYFANDVASDATVGFAYAATSKPAGSAVYFNNNSVGDVDGTAVEDIDLIDLTDTGGSGAPTDAIYNTVGSYTIRCTVYGRMSQSATADKGITVNYKPQFNQFTITSGTTAIQKESAMDISVGWQGFVVDNDTNQLEFQVRDASDTADVGASTVANFASTLGGLQTSLLDQTISDVIDSPTAAGNFRLAVAAEADATVRTTAIFNVAFTHSGSFQYSHSAVPDNGGLADDYRTYISWLEAAEETGTANPSATFYWLESTSIKPLAAGGLIHTDTALSVDWPAGAPWAGAGDFNKGYGGTQPGMFLYSDSETSTELVVHMSASNGEVTSVVSSTPPTPTLTGVSNTYYTITVRAAGDFRTTRKLDFEYQTLGGGWNNGPQPVLVETQRVIGSTIDAVVTGLSPATYYNIRVRGQNDRLNGSFSSNLLAPTLGV